MRTATTNWSGMEISLLGPLEVRDASGRIVALPGAKQRVLLARLLLDAPVPVSADRLVDALWPVDLPSNPSAALRTQVSRLRGILVDAGGGEGILDRVAGGYRLALDGLVVDAASFEACIERARQSEGVAVRLAELDKALELWRGPAWAEFTDDPAFLGHARSLEELHWGAREARVDALIQAGRLSEASSAARRLLEEAPTREGGCALLMRSLHRAGRSHDALTAYREYRDRLATELGLDPSPALEALQVDILRHEEASSPQGAGLGYDGATHGLNQSIRYCRSRDGVRLAYSTVGSGPPLVKAANWLNHLEFDWESPVWRRLFGELAARHTLVRYDERGSGLSERDPPSQSLEDWVRDLEAVVDDLGLERFPLLGISQGCAVCVAYAARHPERVSAMVLHGGYAAGWRATTDYPPDEVARRDASIELVRHGWGANTPAYRQMFTLTFIPGGTAEEIEWFNELERRTVSPEGAARFMEAFAEIDVRDELRRVEAPTLVLHSDGDQRIDPEVGQDLAAEIPDARYVLLESPNHLILEHEPAFPRWMAEIRRFLEEHSGG